MNLKARLAAVEAKVFGGAPGGMTFDIGTWLRERAEGISLEERERRRVAEYPAQAAQIARIFRLVGERRARMQASIRDWRTWAPGWTDEGNDMMGQEPERGE
jgi:hypothetical protein